MRLYYFLTLFLFSFPFLSFSQDTPEDNNTLENQFDKIYRTSTTYQVYKVISKEKFQQLKLNVLDSIKSSKKIILEKESVLKKERAAIEKTKSSLIKTKNDLNTALEKENSISLFGLQLSKIAYNLLLWGIIIVLLLGLSYFIFKFLRSNILTKEAQKSLVDVEQEFEEHRKKALAYQQKLRRQLQDEINKQRNV